MKKMMMMKMRRRSEQWQEVEQSCSTQHLQQPISNLHCHLFRLQFSSQPRLLRNHRRLHPLWHHSLNLPPRHQPARPRPFRSLLPLALPLRCDITLCSGAAGKSMPPCVLIQKRFLVFSSEITIMFSFHDNVDMLIVGC